MYCANCGVRLADTEQRCPLCGTTAYHPEITRPQAVPLYPKNSYPAETVRPKVAQVAVLILFLLPMVITFLIDRQINRQVTWSGFVIGALTVVYVILALPGWFRKPNPVIFIPCGFTALGVYLLYISLATNGGWFLSFAFPIVGCVGAILTAVAALLKYLRRGKLYVLGGACLAFGAFMVLMEGLLVITFHRSFVGWSFYPLAALVALGAFLLYLAINRSARETVERKVFI